ncbi:MAG: 23S rRNA (uracil(1939)-C(5))-methyltransferase RlmD [Burkholderiaceae bacterium]
MNELVRLQPDSLDLNANGVARHEGKIVFVRDALPGETVVANIVRRKPRFDVAQTISIERESNQRVRPPCAHFGVCGGCSMQHLAPAAQLAVKQRVLEDQLLHIGAVRPERVLRPLAGPDFGYRYRARLSARFVIKKGHALVGFREKGSSFVANMTQCPVLPPIASALLMPLRGLVDSLILKKRIPQIEVAVSETDRAGADRGLRVSLVFRHMEPLPPPDLENIRRFGLQHEAQIWLQSKGPETIRPLDPDDDQLFYTLPEFNLHMPFHPSDFTQVNMPVNRAMLSQALRLLDAKPDEAVADLFCGLGNFSLPIARSGAQVTGVELSQTMVHRAGEGAAANGLSGQARFVAQNLFKIDSHAWQQLGRFDKLLIDPPREGAFEVCQAISAAPAGFRPARIVYVSCNPATLARDAGLLVNEGGYRLVEAGIVNMFPHTSHVESMARFELV